MASNCSVSFLFAFLLVFCFCLSSAPSAHGTQPLFSPIQKDNATKLFSIQAYLKTPLQLTNLFLDLGATYTWIDCTSYQSSTYKNIHYNTSLCLQLNTLIGSNCYSPPGPNCFNDSCGFYPENSVTGQISVGNIILDTLALPTTDGTRPGKPAPVSDFEFGCTTTKMLTGLPVGVTGLAALGRINFSFPGQISRAFSSPFVFALCAPSTSSSSGVAIFNSFAPYFFQPGIDVSKLLTYTPLLVNPIDASLIDYLTPSNEYFIGLTGIRVNGKPIPIINQTLLAINQTTGFGGTKVTTSKPYAVLHRSIFTALATAFDAAATALNMKYVSPMKPFSHCYRADTVNSTRLGPAVPTIDLVFPEGVVWSIFGANSMVKIRKNKLCLGFVDGGLNPRTSIVIGGLQLENNLLQFDLVSKRLGFSNSLLSRSTSCSKFNFNGQN